MDYSPPGSSVHGTSQARILEWVAMPFSRRSSQPRDQTHVSCIADEFFTPEPPGKPYCKVSKDYIPSSHQFQMKDFFIPKFLTKVWGMNLSGPTWITSHSLTNDYSQRRGYSTQPEHRPIPTQSQLMQLIPRWFPKEKLACWTRR